MQHDLHCGTFILLKIWRENSAGLNAALAAGIIDKKRK
jgi:hypothetical protein